MTPADLGRAIALTASGMVSLGPLVTHRYPLSDAAAAFALAASRSGLKVLVNPTAAVPAGERA
jgi:threonine dehydrogenase-like Zn-dependent dehydrogenase